MYFMKNSSLILEVLKSSNEWNLKSKFMFLVSEIIKNKQIIYIFVFALLRNLIVIAI